MTIKDAPALRANYGAQRPMNSIRYLVIHYTGNDGDSDEANGSYFANNAVKTSAHYFVDSDSVTRSVPDGYIAWHCGASTYKHPTCRNANSIGIELCDDHKNGVYDFSESELALAAELARELMAAYDIPIENVVRHYDVTGKKCPAPFVDDPAAWAAFKDRLKEDDMDVTRFKELWTEMRQELQDNDASSYSAEAREWAVSTGLVKGGQSKGEDFNGMWQDLMTREQLITVLYRFAQMMGKA